MFGESIDFVLTEDQFAIDFHIEDAAGAFDEFRFDIDGVPDRGCQTDSFRCVVSHHAIGDSNLHGESFVGRRGLQTGGFNRLIQPFISSSAGVCSVEFRSVSFFQTIQE